jgi:dipeptidyl aminopeptidase/acylaminoacyl peptidase
LVGKLSGLEKKKPVTPRDLTAPAEPRTLPLIPRRQFFGNPDKAQPRLSPDGTQLAYLAPQNGVLNIWVGPLGDPSAARCVTEERHRGIRAFFWAFTNQQLLYTQDQNGDEDFHVYCVDLQTDAIKDLTPLAKIRARVEAVSEQVPHEIVVGINDRGERQWHDLYRINVTTGERQLLQENPGFAGFVVDDAFRVRFGVRITPQAGQMYLVPDTQQGWQEFLEIGTEDALTTSVVRFDKTGDRLYLLDSRGRNTAALKALDVRTGESRLLAEDVRADIDGVLVHPTEHHVQAVTSTHARQQWQTLDPAVAPDLDYLRQVTEGDLQVLSRTQDDRLWTVAYSLDHGPTRFYLYRRDQRRADFLFSSNGELERLPLARMSPEVVPARDELELICYLTLPLASDPQHTGRPQKPLPLVLLVHGGPWARDYWGYHAQHQLLANRGYAVLSVNYRGSTGFGKAFINAANGEWAGKMHDDLLDAAQWAVRQKIALPDKIAIMGGSFGGYAALVGLTLTPTAFACGVDIVGPSSLVTLLNNPPPYWVPILPVMKVRVGDHTTAEGRRFLESRSPLSYVDKIQRPLLIGQGQHDPRVKQAESDQIVQAMKERKIPVTYLLFQDEGHGFARPENRFAFFAVAEAFLAQHLGGWYEPIGDAFEGAAFSVPSGQDGAPGLAQALRQATGVAAQQTVKSP